MSEDLQGHRQEIDRIDDQILRLLNERSKSVIEIGKLKKQRDAEAHLHTPAREAAIDVVLTDLIPTNTTFAGNLTTTQGSVTGSQGGGVTGTLGTIAAGA